MKIFLHEGICPIRDIISLFGDKWSLLVLVSLSANGTMRFTEIQKSIGEISQRMLTITLKTLVGMNLVHRASYPEIPPRVEYTLTKLGKTLIPHIDSLVNWALTNSSELSISPSRPRWKTRARVTPAPIWI